MRWLLQPTGLQNSGDYNQKWPRIYIQLPHKVINALSLIQINKPSDCRNLWKTRLKRQIHKALGDWKHIFIPINEIT